MKLECQSCTSVKPKGGIGRQSARDTTASLVDPTGTTFTEGLCRHPRDTWHRDLCWTSGAYSVPAQIHYQNFGLPILARSSILSVLVFQRISCSCSSSSESEMMARSSAYRFSQRHPVRNCWERVFRTVMKRSSGKSPGELFLSHWTFHSGCCQQPLYF